MSDRDQLIDSLNRAIETYAILNRDFSLKAFFQDDEDDLSLVEDLVRLKAALDEDDGLSLTPLLHSWIPGGDDETL